MKLEIAEDLKLPLDAATQTFAFIARKGGGKTYAAGKLVELLLDAGVQVVVLDTVGNWYGLRLAADGKSQGFDVPVLGGLRGDIPLEAAGGTLIADIVVETGSSLVLDASQFNLADRKRFATAFGERLWQQKKAERHPSPLMLVIEESQLIVPQFTKGAETMVGIFEEIIRLGRNYGIGVTMITQRPQSVNKEVLNQTECLFVGQVNGAQERDALKKWITHQGMDVHLVDELPALKVGTFYVWSPQWLNRLQKVAILPKGTYDASATPKVGDRRVQRELKPLDLTELQTRLKETIERKKADDPRELRKQIAELKKTVDSLNRRAPIENQPAKIIEKFVLEEGQLARAEKLVDQAKDRLFELDVLIGKVQSLGQFLREAYEPIAAAITQTRAPQPQPTPPPRREQLRPSTPTAPHPTAAPARQATAEYDGAPLPPGELATLTAALQYPGLLRKRLSVLTGYKRSSRDAYIARLAAKGLVDVQGQQLHATDAGRAALNGSFEPLPTGRDLIEYWRQRLPEGERRTFDVLVQQEGNDVEKETIDESTGYKRSSRDAYLVRLKARGLVEFAGRGLVRASTELFE